VKKTNSKIIAEFGQRFNIWDIPPQRQWGPDSHPAPFPEKLVADHISSWTSVGDCVLDPFLGSGTTGRVAILMNRRFIGIDISEKYVRASRKRIQGVASVWGPASNRSIDALFNES
jgi:site-specific DNA-methyltransferase (adenine-specific)